MSFSFPAWTAVCISTSLGSLFSSTFRKSVGGPHVGWHPFFLCISRPLVQTLRGSGASHLEPEPLGWGLGTWLPALGCHLLVLSLILVGQLSLPAGVEASLKGWLRSFPALRFSLFLFAAQPQKNNSFMYSWVRIWLTVGSTSSFT